MRAEAPRGKRSLATSMAGPNDDDIEAVTHAMNRSLSYTKSRKDVREHVIGGPTT